MSLSVPLLPLPGYQPSVQGMQAWPFAGVQARPFADVQAFVLEGALPRPGCQGVSPCWSKVVAGRLRRARLGIDAVVASSCAAVNHAIVVTPRVLVTN